MNFNNKKYQKYLPSQKFIIISGVVIVLMIIIYVIFFMSSGSESFSITGNGKNTPLKVENQSIGDLIAKDTDGDGIPDWEEALWGTDPNKKMTFGDTPDAVYIANKKKELKIEGSINEKNLTETDKFAREFFSSYAAMKSSGQIDKNTINSFSSSLGQKIADPNLIDRYLETDIKINNAIDITTEQKYYQDVKTLFKSYQKGGIGDELDIISRGLASNSTNDSASNNNGYAKLPIIAKAYQDFAKKIMEMSVPQNLTEFHLRIANNANNTGISISNMAKIMTDPIVGLSGLSQYQKYSDDLVKSVADLENFLLKQ